MIINDVFYLSEKLTNTEIIKNKKNNKEAVKINCFLYYFINKNKKIYS